LNKDRGLLRSSLQVTRAEFDQIYSAYAGSVFGFALNLTRDTEAAREVLQEVFLRAIRRPELGMRFQEAKSWLFRLTHNLVIDLHRRAGTRARILERVAEESASPFASSPDPDEQSFREAVAAAMAELPEEQRAVVHLKLWENLSFSEIGQALDLSPNTAASRYRYALDKLQTHLRYLYEEIR
jgi:RNA polymerase sigma-70 factor (ECF subfamily)